jgi:hypothetical protein
LTDLGGAERLHRKMARVVAQIGLLLLLGAHAAPGEIARGTAGGDGPCRSDCVGDCDCDLRVGVEEIVRAVRIVLGDLPDEACVAGGRGVVINALVTAVRLALEGCTATRDYARFERFELSRHPALGFCPPLGRVFSASIGNEGGAYRLTRTRLVAGELGVDPCIPDLIEGGECPVVRADADRLLSAAELETVRAAFARVTVYNGPDPFCLNGYFDPCVVTAARWDTAGIGDFPCAGRRFAPGELERLSVLIEGLAGGGDPPACGNGLPEAGEACDAVEPGCAANCTVATERLCRFDPERSRVTLQRPSLDVTAQVRGSLTVVTGVSREDTVTASSGVFLPGQIPVASTGFTVDPFPVAGLGCLCVNADAAGRGVVDCGEHFGAAAIGHRVAVWLLSDRGACAEGHLPDGSCEFPDYGPDCRPCTGDDLPATPLAGAALGTGALFFGDELVQGERFDCAPLLDGAGGAVSGAGLVGRVALADGNTALLQLVCE